MIRAPFSSIVLLVVAGCAAITEPLGIEDPFAIPQPFQGVERNDRMIAQAIVVPALVVELPVGLSSERAVALRDQVIEAARRRDLPALAEPTPMAWLLRGQSATLRSTDQKEAPVNKAFVAWSLVDGTGKERTQFAVSFFGDELKLTEAEVHRLAEETIAKLDAALLRPRTQAVDIAVAAPVDKPVAWIATINGAPGDGNSALARALSAILPLKGVQIALTKGKAQWRIEGKVEVTAASVTLDLVTLTWRVLDGKGKEAGTIRQQNPVPKGRLSKSWGQLAAFAAEAAAEGIAQLIQQVSAPKTRLGRVATRQRGCYKRAAPSAPRVCAAFFGKTDEASCRKQQPSARQPDRRVS